MHLQISCTLTFTLPMFTPFVLMLRPESDARQRVAAEDYNLLPSAAVSEFTDNYGNFCERLVVAVF